MATRSDQKSFSIVEFTIDNGVEVIPSSWIAKDLTFCKFPSPIQKGYPEIQKHKSFVPDKSWTDYAINHVGSYGKQQYKYINLGSY
jgi:hypothetical protein